MDPLRRRNGAGERPLKDDLSHPEDGGTPDPAFPPTPSGLRQPAPAEASLPPGPVGGHPPTRALYQRVWARKP